MKEGTAYGEQLKRAYARLRAEVPAPEIPPGDDPIYRLALGVLGGGCMELAARQAVERLLARAVDWNDVRVSLPSHLAGQLAGLLPDAPERARRLTRVLQAVFERENRLSLDKLRTMPRREAKQYLEKLDGIDAFTIASVMLWSLGGHAIPVNQVVFEALRSTGLVHPEAGVEEVQAFLERHVPAEEAKAFCLIMEAAAARLGAPGSPGKRSARKGSEGKEPAPAKPRRRRPRAQPGPPPVTEEKETPP
ncbi:MAG TPA: hypothetical protein PKK06_10340 [Phycisphaerae bacterium]|nr:hypothetical protein [Phycisphaerae bacterium]HNU45761.1 hypothetical protein [Phycisphaerae bacterium]